MASACSVGSGAAGRVCEWSVHSSGPNRAMANGAEYVLMELPVRTHAAAMVASGKIARETLWRKNVPRRPLIFLGTSLD